MNITGKEKMIGEKNEKSNVKKKHILLMFQNTTQTVKNKLFCNDSKGRRMAYSCSKKTISIIQKNRV